MMGTICWDLDRLSKFVLLLRAERNVTFFKWWIAIEDQPLINGTRNQFLILFKREQGTSSTKPRNLQDTKCESYLRVNVRWFQAVIAIAGDSGTVIVDLWEFDLLFAEDSQPYSRIKSRSLQKLKIL